MVVSAASRGSLSGGELVALTLVAMVVLLLALAFFAYTIKNQTWENIRDSNVFGLTLQVGIAVLVIFAIVLLMARDVITTAAGVPVITGIVGLVFGKGLDISKKT